MHLILIQLLVKPKMAEIAAEAARRHAGIRPIAARTKGARRCPKQPTWWTGSLPPPRHATLKPS
jgi:hypothetical protein